MEKKAFSLLLAAVALTMCLGLLPIHGEEKIYDSTLRLHVLANSDSDEDQALKLLVRDDILALTCELLGDCETKEDAERVLRSKLDLIERTANECLARSGSSYTAAVTLDVEKYPTREYDGMSFPSGRYLSLRVMIGSAEGKNWWCVLFPPICLSAARAESKRTLEDGFVAAGLTPEQYKIITENGEDGEGRYRIRFKILEIIEELRERLK